MNQKAGCLYGLLGLFITYQLYEFVTSNVLIFIYVLLSAIFMAILVYHVRTEEIQKIFNQIISDNTNRIQKFNLIAYNKSHQVDEYNDTKFDQRAFDTELQILLDKLYPATSKYAERVRGKIKNYVLQSFESFRYQPKLFDDIQYSGSDFEKSLANYFEKLGYVVTLSAKTGDQGADLILLKGNKKIVVQAKYYTGSVGNKAVQEVIAAIGFYNCDEGWVITNSKFTKSAHELAIRSRIKLFESFNLQNDLVDSKVDVTNCENEVVTITDSNVLEHETHNSLNSLGISTQGYLYDILEEINEIKNMSIDDNQHSIYKTNDVEKLRSEYDYAILFDISKIALLLEINMNEEKPERDILLFCFIYFRYGSQGYSHLVTNNYDIINEIDSFTDVMNTPHPLKNNGLFLGDTCFKNYIHIYTKKLREIVTLVISYDFNLTNLEQKILDYYKELESATAS